MRCRTCDEMGEFFARYFALYPDLPRQLGLRARLAEAVRNGWYGRGD